MGFRRLCSCDFPMRFWRPLDPTTSTTKLARWYSILRCIYSETRLLSCRLNILGPTFQCAFLRPCARYKLTILFMIPMLEAGHERPTTASSAKNILRAKGKLKAEPIRDNLDN